MEFWQYDNILSGSKLIKKGVWFCEIQQMEQNMKEQVIPAEFKEKTVQ